MSKPQNTFAQFTNQYELSKTLRFELKPVGGTQQLLEANNVFAKDEAIQEKYTETKKYFDKLHRKFVADSLKDLQFSDLENYSEALASVKKITRDTDKKQKDSWNKELEVQEKRLRKEVVEQFNNTAKVWATEKFSGLKNKDIKFLEEVAVFEKVLFELYGKDENGELVEKTIVEIEKVNKKTGEITIEKESIFKGWKGFTGYFGKFFETRKNFYKDDGTSTAIATRIVDQNLRRFVENKWLIENYDSDFLKILDMADLQEIKNLESYADFVLQGDKEKTQGINRYNDIVGVIKSKINKYRQDTKQKISYLKTLDKQILSEKDKFFEEIENETQLKAELEKLLKTGEEKIEILKKLFSNFVEHQEDYDLTKIYFSKKGFETISRKWSSEREKWEDNLAKVFKDKEKKTLTKKKDVGYSFPDFIPLEYLKNALEKIFEENKKEEVIEKINFWKEKYNQQESTKENIWIQFLEIFTQEFFEFFEYKKNTDKGLVKVGYDIFSQKLSSSLQVEKLEVTKDLKADVKDFADSLLSFYQFSKYFAVEKSKKWDDSASVDSHFYTIFKDEFYDNTFESIIQPYNLLRNYLTKKPWEGEQKWKLNFEHPTLSDGWDKNKESANASIILRKEGKYFLALMKKGCTHLFDDKNKEKFAGKSEEKLYKKMVYKYLPDAAKMIPKGSTQLKTVKKHFEENSSNIVVETKAFKEPLLISKRIFELNNVRYDKSDIVNITDDEKSGIKQFQKDYLRLSNDFETYKKALTDWINFCKDFLSKYESTKDFDQSFFKKTEKYNSLDEFYKDIEKISYKISWESVSEEYIEEKNKSGEVYLFQIKNKDWNDGVTGTKNLHTLYFESLFSDENKAQNFVMKMNGQAEIFYRPKTKGFKKEKIITKNNKITLEKGKSAFAKNRYTKNKIFFHLPMTMNRGTGKPFSFNQQINKFLANNPDINIIGVDRGEKHLAYYSVINQKGKILKDPNTGKALSDSLNVINGVDYHYLLEKKASEREQQRKDWQSVQGIKDLKKGYISQVVHKLANLIIKHNAIIVFEDLNMRFKQIRGGIEKSVYQQLEKALIDKLNFLADKKKNVDEIGGILKAYQLAAPVEAFKDMGKQTGIMFYTTASYTSKIDPVTGWRPNVYFKKGSAKVNKENILKFDKIFFNTEKERFEITYDLKKIIKSDKAKYPQKTIWTVCSNVERWKGSRKERNNNQWGYDEYPAIGEESITGKLKELFQEYEINTSENILDQIKNLEITGNEKFFSDFLFYFQLICQIRNTDGKLHNKIEQYKRDDKYDQITEQEIFDADFILSPVEKDGEFFDSRNPENEQNGYPKNGDDNGAFNIAKKGIITLQRVSEWGDLSEEEKEKIKYPDLFIGNNDWDDFVAE